MGSKLWPAARGVGDGPLQDRTRTRQRARKRTRLAECREGVCDATGRM